MSKKHKQRKREKPWLRKQRREREAERAARAPTQRGMDRRAAGRSCGTCTACCWALSVRHDPAHPVWGDDGLPSFTACAHSTEHDGCGVYADRPIGCRKFDCAWLLGMPGMTDADRPDSIGVVFTGTQHASGDRLALQAFEVEPGAAERGRGRAICDALRLRGIAVFVMHKDRRKLLVPLTIRGAAAWHNVVLEVSDDIRLDGRRA